MKIAFAEIILSLTELACRAGGILYTRGDAPPIEVSGLCTDSREADGTTMLCAIRGERVDGHRFLPGAARAGCRAFLCERLPEGWTEMGADSPMGDGSAAAVVVPDTVAAFSRLALARREEELSHLRITAVTGSVGKTTTKEMIAAVLGTRHTLFKKDGNYNSTIGLPLSVLEVPRAAQAAVLEMGMSGRGEIAAMTEAVRPDIAIVANIGSSHLEHLGTRENIACAKLEIARGLRPGGTLLINGDEPLLAALGQDLGDDRPVIPADIRVLRLSLRAGAEADYAASGIAVCGGGMRFDLTTPEGVLRGLWVPALGEHLVWAAAFAAVVGRLYGLDESAIRAGLSAYRPADMRQSVRCIAGVTLIEDCYNAAPESMRAALSVLASVAETAAEVACEGPVGGEIPRGTPGGAGAMKSAGRVCGRRVAVLGDMRELGTDSVALHAAVGAEAVRCGVELLMTVGALGAHIAAGAREAGMGEACIRVTAADGEDPRDSYPETARALCAYLRPGDCVLIKASRAMAAERLASALGDCLGELED